MKAAEPFRVLVADPPWAFGDKLPGKSRGAAKNYGTLTVNELCAMGNSLAPSLAPFFLPSIADDAWLFLWRVSAMVEEAYQVVRAWGFVPKSEMVWLKQTSSGLPHFGMGRYVRASHETCIIATRGRVQPAQRSVRSRFEAVVGQHSEKPSCFFDIVHHLVGADCTPRLELFARQRRPGWHAIGDELR